MRVCRSFRNRTTVAIARNTAVIKLVRECAEEYSTAVLNCALESAIDCVANLHPIKTACILRDLSTMTFVAHHIRHVCVITQCRKLRCNSELT